MEKSGKILAAKIFGMVMVFVLALTTPVWGQGIPVIDGANLTQNTVNAFENVAQTLKQIEEYEQQVMQYMTQLEQLEDQIKNTAAPAMYLWDKAESTMKKAQDLQSRIEGLYASVGDMDKYLDKLGTVDYWKGNEFYDLKRGGTLEGRKEISDHHAKLNEAQLEANKDLLITLKDQKESLSDEASRLSSLQAGAESAGGRMEAIQSTNQLMSQQNAMLLNMKTIMLAQSQALAQKMVAEQQAQAEAQARNDALVQGTFVPGKEPNYKW